MSSSLVTALAQLEPVDLGSLNLAAQLMTRRDRKYIVPIADAADLICELAESSRVLVIGARRRFGYESVYFDTNDLETYLAAARGRPRRFKIRTRSYLDTGTTMIEIKQRDGRGNTDKRRTDHTAALSDVLDEHALEFIAASPAVTADASSLAPVLRTTYQRSTLLLGDGQRLTIDTDLRSVNNSGRAAELTDMAIIETKATRATTVADRLLWARGFRPLRVSKFCTSMAVLEPDLPSNRWTRALAGPWQLGQAA